jgi:hypothetical protein
VMVEEEKKMLTIRSAHKSDPIREKYKKGGIKGGKEAHNNTWIQHQYKKGFVVLINEQSLGKRACLCSCDPRGMKKRVIKSAES